MVTSCYECDEPNNIILLILGTRVHRLGRAALLLRGRTDVGSAGYIRGPAELGCPREVGARLGRSYNRFSLSRTGTA